MPSINVKCKFNRAAAISKLKAANNAALTHTGNQALKDITQHVPKDQGALQSSGLSHSDIRAENGTYTMRWDEPYAQYLFHGKVMHGSPTMRTYGPEKLNFTGALARMEWTKYAADVYGDQWQRVYQAAFKMEMKK